MGITRQQALDCFASDDLIGIGMEADAVRRRLHPEGVVSYVIDRNITFSPDLNSIYEEVQAAADMGGTGILLQGGLDCNTKIETLEHLFTGIKQRFPALWLHALSANEILTIARASDTSLRDTITRLRDAGLDSIADASTPILDDTTEDWISVHRTAHQLGMRTIATMLFEDGDTIEQRVRHLEIVHTLQEETGGFTAFIPASSLPSSIEYLKTLAISRMFLDNIDNVQSSWSSQGLKVLQMGLRFGSNDVGSIMLETAGPSNLATEEELRRIIRDAGFKPVQRDTLYRAMFIN